MIHELKILPQYFEEVWNDNKNFELRKDDILYQIGDKMKLLEYNGEKFTGRYIVKTISYLLKDVEKYGLKKGFVIIGMK